MSTQATAAHHTAWLVNIPSCLDQPMMDVTVLADEPVYDVNSDGEEYIHGWTSTGDPVFTAITNVPAEDGEIADGLADAKRLLRDGGWNTVGEWDVTDNAYVITVEHA